MGNITLSIPENLHEKMKKHEEIKWSEVARKAIQKKIEDLEMLERLTKKSRLTESDVEKISKKVNKAAARKLGLK
jgi:predicted CopG family antitoxin